MNHVILVTLRKNNGKDIFKYFTDMKSAANFFETKIKEDEFSMGSLLFSVRKGK